MRVGRGAKVKVDEETVDAVFESKSYERCYSTSSDKKSVQTGI